MRSIAKRLLLAGAFSLIPMVAAGVADQAQAVVDAAISGHDIPGLSAGIAIDGEIIWTGTAGTADIDAGIAVTNETRFRIASISKVLTAVAVLQLAEQGRLDLEAPVQTYLPDYPRSPRGPMTVRHLLAHTSGIRHPGDAESRVDEHYDSMREACRVFEDRKLASTPGTKYRYSSYGYSVLGAVIESVTETSFESYMAEHVWGPAGMSHTGLDRRPVSMESTAELYARKRGSFVVDVHNDLSVIYPGGGMVSTAGDLLRFVVALESGKLLSAESRNLMFEHPAHGGKVLDEHGGLGWNVWDHEHHGTLLMRIGGQSGTSSLLVSYRDRGVTVVLLTNVSRLDPIWTLTNELIGIGLESKSSP